MTETDQLLDVLQEWSGGPLRIWNLYLSKHSYLKLRVDKYANHYVVYWDTPSRRENFEDPLRLMEYLAEHISGVAEKLAEPMK